MSYEKSEIFMKIFNKLDILEKNNLELININKNLANKLNQIENILENKLDDIESKILEINKTLFLIKNSRIYINDFKLNELTKTTHINICKDINHDIIIKKLSMRNDRSILSLLNIFYKSNNNKELENNKINYPFRLKGKVGFEYYSNGKWIEDIYGDSVIDLILFNFNKVFKSVNLYPNKIKKINDFMENQKFIDELSINNNSSKQIHMDFRKTLKRHLRVELEKN